MQITTPLPAAGTAGHRPVPPARPPTTLPRQDPIHRALTSACRRRPDLADALITAGDIVRRGTLHTLPGVAPTLALCTPAGAVYGNLIRLAPRGLECDCLPAGGANAPGRVGKTSLAPPCPHILAYLLAVYLDRTTAIGRSPILTPLPYTPADLWAETLGVLQPQLPRAAFSSWLGGARLMLEASSLLQLTVAVPSPYAVEWLTHRLQHVVARSARAAAGYWLQIVFVSQYYTK